MPEPLARSHVRGSASEAGLELMEHQVEGVDFLRSHPSAALYDEPGLGKTAQLLLSAREPALVIAPAMVLDSSVWDDEVAKWAPGIDLTQVAYTSLTQKGPKGRIYRDANGWPTNPPKEPYRRQWGSKIADESHYLKGRKTNWTGAFLQLRADECRLATGTPIPNWAEEAFTSLQALYPEEAKPGKRLGSYWRWAREWFDVGPTLWSPMAVGRLRADRTWAEFNEVNWGDRMLLRLRENCLDLPPLTVQPWVVRMGAKQRKAYRELEKDFITWLDSGAEVSAWSSAAQSVKLAKCATGLEILSPGAGGSAKLDALEGILADRPRQTLVVAHFRHSVEAAARSAEKAGKTAFVVHGGVPAGARRRDRIRAFQRGSLDVLCASIDTISEGLTLHQGGADQVVRLERSWRPYKNEQVNRRLHRLGQERPVLAIDLITKDTADEGQLELLAEKEEHQMLALGRGDLRRLVRR